MKRSYPNNPIVLGTLLAALYDALTKTLTALAKAHGNAPGPWLDELEHAVLQAIKNSTSDCASLEREATAVAAALDLVGERFQSLRKALAADDNRV